MTYASGGAAAVTATAAIANAIKASGVLIKVDQSDFLTIFSRAEKPLVITALGGVVKKNYQYLMSYKGFAFYTKSATPLILSGKAEIISAKQIWIPG